VNARPFKKDDPRINRKGRPKKGQAMTDILNWALDQKRAIKDGEDGGEKMILIRQALADKLISKALDDGDVTALRYIYDRIDGRPKETIKLDDGSIDVRLKEIMSNGE
jgi:hypothetical protein